MRFFVSMLRRLIISGATSLALIAGAGPLLAAESDVQVDQLSRALLFGAGDELKDALEQLTSRGDTDSAAAMILALRYKSSGSAQLRDALQALTGHDGEDWFDWMVWQERNPGDGPHESFAALKLEVLERIDPNFLRFFPDEETLDGLRIRLEEITWGGVRVDGIPSLDNPELIGAGEADYLLDSDLVFGVEINGDARAYPLRIMGWHEMFNEVIGGVPVALAYCTLCGSGILFETQVENRDAPLVFGSSGLLYRSNKLMFDRETDSLWNQFTGRPVSGPLVDSGIELKIRPVVITSWAEWRAAHPDSRVLSLDTGHRRNYASGFVYYDYFASPDLMFPTVVDETLFAQKSYVFGIRDVAVSKAWPIDAFEGGAVINDAIGARNIVLIGDAATRTVRAYERAENDFQTGVHAGELTSPEGVWQIGEEALIGPQGTMLARVPGHIAYWFAWNGYLGLESEIYGVEQ